MFAFTASAHFAPIGRDLVAMVPDVFPYPSLIVYATGVLEILGAVGLLIPRTRGLAGLCLLVLLVAMFPAKVNAAVQEVGIGGRPPTPLALRLAIQLFFIGILWWATRPASLLPQAGNARVRHGSRT
jgi:uncharacterized membrane protein